ncbi:CYTH domain-containing protein [Bacillus spongiae]|uniref:CYTH domain-containing protein n=1 Tax=Bacillus spongiae TaxID=2683610 RepID=A0ABU8HB73_9BACI
MSQEIEIEFKNMLTKDEFNRLKHHFSIKENQFSIQVNDYFDTPTFALKQLGCALRIRKKNQKTVLTLKQPLQVGLLETHQPISNLDREHFIQSGHLPDGEVKEALLLLSSTIKKLVHFGDLQTNRAEFNYKGGLLVLDHSTYLNTQDFELEYEVQNPETGSENFLSLLDELNIPIRKSDNKIKRFYLAKMKNND